MKNLILLFVIAAVATLFSCNKDTIAPESEVFVGFQYDGVSYLTPQLKIEALGEVSPGLYEYDIILLSEGITIEQSVEGEKGYFLQMKVNSTHAEILNTGVYEFSETDQDGAFKEGLAVLDFETPATFGQVIQIVEGGLSVTEMHGKIEVMYTLETVDGKQITGLYTDFLDRWRVY
ncbi:hypothetical protein GCM10027429_17770 [Marivirga atlantica]|jgi:hypothetical protein|uniref:DUF4843 domain-containing protein n=1 Tax=Marivirga atlantica TaxID=1548457 RepID=A0A937DH13_9BACT|nr:hypothetical protein [Marivirga atlantica]MBL0765393.1 hypothetical protein [Marivirga atlantica]